MDPNLENPFTAPKSSFEEPAYASAFPERDGEINYKALNEGLRICWDNKASTLLLGVVILILGFLNSLGSNLAKNQIVTDPNIILVMTFLGQFIYFLATPFIRYSCLKATSDDKPLMNPKTYGKTLGAQFVTNFYTFFPFVAIAMATPLIVPMLLKTNTGPVLPIVVLYTTVFILSIFIYIRTMFAPMIMLQYPESGISEVIKDSWKATKGQGPRIFLMHIAFAGILILGLIPCGLGLLFTLPAIYMTQAVMFRQLEPKITIE